MARPNKPTQRDRVLQYIRENNYITSYQAYTELGCTQLANRLNESKNKVQLLQRVFKKTWELLGTHTRLKEVYKDIELPDPKNPRSIPTPARLNYTIFEFRHDGKIKGK